ncbi:dTDP-4-dehydrorhamnose 3 5-epimerase, partial [termite gut metagenome]
SVVESQLNLSEKDKHAAAFTESEYYE